ALARTVGFKNTDGKITARLARKRNVIAARGPNRRRVVSFAETDALCRPAGRGHHVNLLAATAIAFETDAGAIRRITWRSVDRRRVGEACGLLGSQVHHKQVGIASLLKTHDDALTVRGKSRGEGHARKIADDFPLPSLDVQKIDTRIALPIRHV